MKKKSNYFIILFFSLLFCYALLFCVGVRASGNELLFYYDDNSGTFIYCDIIPDNCKRYLKMILQDNDNDGVYDEIYSFKEFNNYWADVWQESDTYSVDILYFCSNELVYYSYNDLSNVGLDEINSNNATLLIKDFPTQLLSNSFLSKYHSIGFTIQGGSTTEDITTEDITTEDNTTEVASSTDAFSVGNYDNTNIVEHLVNIEILLWILVVFICAFIVHMLFRTIFNKILGN